MEVPFVIQWGVPAGALAFAVVGYVWFWFDGRRLDRRFGKHG